MEGVFRAWGRILAGYRPNLSIEITRECPLRCPGCYAYGSDHLGGGVLALVDRLKPLHLSIVGGEPLVCRRELETLLPILAARGVYTQLVTSAVAPIPAPWASLPRLQICVSIDGLQPEHDRRRAPATYDRIERNIAGQRVTVHCTVTRQQGARDGYLDEFLRRWSDNPNVRTIWISLYTPQTGEQSDECLTVEDRARVIAELRALRPHYPKLQMPVGLLDALAAPPASPQDCIFAQTTECVSADLERRITPCQFGGTPDCARCGCMASAALAAVGRHRLPGGLRVESIFRASLAVGERTRRRAG
jgi:organic radical activating enzyme